MSGPAVVLAWAGINFVLWVVYWAVFEPDREGVAIYASAILIVVLVATWAALRTRKVKVPSDREPSANPDMSHAAALAGIVVAAAALSTEFGPWLAYGAAIAAPFAIGGLIREWRAQRMAEHEVRLRHPHRSEETAK